MPALVTITIVTFNSRRYIRRCLEAILAQEWRPFEVIVVDNASLDGTRLILGEFQDRIRTIYNDRNLGFAAGQNQAFAAGRGEWFLTLNPDVLLLPGFIARLMAAAQWDDKVGTVCGKLLRIGIGFEPLKERRIDSAGIFFTPNMRHFDRGWQEPDDERYQKPEYVFGASAAAALYRRQMVEDVSQEDGFFDPDFFAYREDADVSWRAQLQGWRCLYTPDAEAYHVRRVVPGTRSVVPAVLNMHSVKNRFLMRIKNITGDMYKRFWFSATARDLVILFACLVYEPSSLSAFWKVGRCFRRACGKRREIMSRRRVSDEYMAAWFRTEPSAQPAAEFALR